MKIYLITKVTENVLNLDHKRTLTIDQRRRIINYALYN